MSRSQQEIDELQRRLNRATALARAELMRRGLSEAEIQELLDADPRQPPAEEAD